MTFDPTNSRLFDPFTKADLPVLKHVVFTPDESTFVHPIHLQYVRDTMRGHGVQVVEEFSAGVQRTLPVFFGAAAGVFPGGRSMNGSPALWELTAFSQGAHRKLSVSAGVPRTGQVTLGDRQVPLTHAVAVLRPEPAVAEAPKDLTGAPLPLKLVPATTWVGRPVFCPCVQQGDVPTWEDTDDEPYCAVALGYDTFATVVPAEVVEPERNVPLLYPGEGLTPRLARMRAMRACLLHHPKRTADGRGPQFAPADVLYYNAVLDQWTRDLFEDSAAITRGVTWAHWKHTHPGSVRYRVIGTSTGRQRGGGGIEGQLLVTYAAIPAGHWPGTPTPDPFEAHTRTAREFVESFEVAGYRWPAEPGHLLGEPPAESPESPPTRRPPP